MLFLRKSHGSRLNVFAPANDLSALSKSGSEARSFVPGKKNDVAISGGQILGDEYSDHVVKVGTPILCGPVASLAFVRIGVGLSSAKGKFHDVLQPSKRLSSFFSTLLKSDQWLRESTHVENEVRGAINFRNISGTKIYALGQPTLEAIDEVVERVQHSHPESRRIIWIVLREEPIVYVNGAPYCLRREGFSLRNMKGQVFSASKVLFVDF